MTYEDMTDTLNSVEIYQFFSYSHLPDDLATVSKWFGDVAKDLILTIPNCAERSVALRKLLEAKDAAVRARLQCR